LAVLFCIILYTRGAGALLRKGASGEGESGVPEEVPPQAPSQNRPISNGQITRRRPRQFEIENLDAKREKHKGGLRRVAERKEGPQVGVGPRGGCRLGLASRTDPASENSVSPTRSTGRAEIYTFLGSIQDPRIEGAPNIRY